METTNEPKPSRRGGIDYPQWQGPKAKPPFSKRLGRWFLWAFIFSAALMLAEFLAIKILGL